MYQVKLLQKTIGDSSRKVEVDRRAIRVVFKKLLWIVSVNSKDLELACAIVKWNDGGLKMLRKLEQRGCLASTREEAPPPPPRCKFY